MAFDRARAQQTLIRMAKAGPGRLRGPIGRSTRRLRSEYRGEMVSVIVPVSDEETTRVGVFFDTLRAQTFRNLDILVVPYGRHDKVLATVAAHAAADWRIRVRRRPAGSLAEARNQGVAAARAQLVLVAGGGDEFPSQGIERLVRSHLATGSPLVVGHMQKPIIATWVADAAYDAAHRVDVARTTLAASPIAITDLGVGNKLFTAELWRTSGLRFTDELASGVDVAVGLLRAASAFDLLKESTYVPARRSDGIGVGAMPDILSGLDDWIAEHERTFHLIEDLANEDIRRWWLWGTLDTAVQPLIDDVERADDHQWATLRDLVTLLLEDADEDLWASLAAEARVKLWLLRQGKRRELAEYAAAQLFTAKSRATRIRDGKVYALLPFHDDPAVGVPPELFEMTVDESRLRAVLREVRWREDEIEFTIFAAIEYVDLTDLPALEVALVDQADGAKIPLAARQFRDLRANQGPRQAHRRQQDKSWGAFSVTVDLADLVAASERAGLGADGRTWSLEVTLEVDGVRRTGPVQETEKQASAGFIGRDHLAPRPAAGALVGLSPRSTSAGLWVRPDQEPRLSAVQVQGRRITGVLDPRGATVTGLKVESSGLQATATLTPAPDGLTFVLDLPSVATGQRRWTLRALTSAAPVPVGWPARVEQWIGVGQGEVVLSRTAGGKAEILEAADGFVVDELSIDGLDVTVRGRWLAAAAPAGTRIELVGQKATFPGVLSADSSGVRVDFRLEHDPWGLGMRPAPTGTYPVTLRTGASSRIAPLGETAIDHLYEFTTSAYYTARVVAYGRDCNLEIQRALVDEDRGQHAQVRLQEWYRDTDFPLEPDAVYLQSYVGASATDSQLAIFEELRRQRPDLRVYWGVADAASWVPEGATPVLMNSREWYRVLGSVKYLCQNIDPERWFSRKPGQQLLQTFHGYPAKSMGLRMWHGKHFTPLRIERELLRTSGGWDLILTPAPEMDEHYRREYAYDGPIHSHGYPRDDVLVGPDADRLRAETRERLGIAPDKKVVLYAPTWRDDQADNWRQAEMVQHLDLAAASRALGPEYVLLMRGHRFHSAASSPINDGSTRYLDVTDYPEINHLILASDAAVLDYSSLRFDFALTQRPMIFLVPDLDSYVGGVRGFLYDYSDSAPGPLVDTADEAVRLLRDLPGLTRATAAERERFHAAYNYLQDGTSARRVVAAFFGDAGQGQ